MRCRNCQPRCKTTNGTWFMIWDALVALLVLLLSLAILLMPAGPLNDDVTGVSKGKVVLGALKELGDELMKNGSADHGCLVMQKGGNGAASVIYANNARIKVVCEGELIKIFIDEGNE